MTCSRHNAKTCVDIPSSSCVHSDDIKKKKEKEIERTMRRCRTGYVAGFLHGWGRALVCMCYSFQIFDCTHCSISTSKDLSFGKLNRRNFFNIHRKWSCNTDITLTAASSRYTQTSHITLHKWLLMQRKFWRSSEFRHKNSEDSDKAEVRNVALTAELLGKQRIAILPEYARIRRENSLSYANNAWPTQSG